jgi:hydroxymethylglutaryl-CoA synthase
MISTVTGTEVREEVAGVEYWLQHILQPVRYLQAVQVVVENSVEAASVVEMGPDQTLTRLAQATLIELDAAASVECVHGSGVMVALKQYPLATRRHRLLQQVTREDASMSTVYSGYLHGGIRKEWLQDSVHILLEIIVAVGSKWKRHSLPSNVGVLVRDVRFLKSDPGVIAAAKEFKCKLTDTGTLTVQVLAADSSTSLLVMGQAVTVTPMPEYQQGHALRRATPDGLGLNLVSELYRGTNEARAVLVLLPQENAPSSDHTSVPPAVLDTMVQLATHIANETRDTAPLAAGSLVVGIARLQFYKTSGSSHLGSIHVKRLPDRRRCRIVDVALYSTAGELVLHLEGVQFLGPDQIPPALGMSSYGEPIKCATEVGILAMDYYCPDLCVRAADIEDYHGCKGQYTKGRGQDNVTFCSDDEDAVSMAMTALSRLMQRCGLEFDEIGRLEVGTESQVDRAKSIKSFLMALFEAEGVYNVEGADTYNACYGGTNALFNAVNWIQSSAWNGKYAIVVCTDTAVHPDPVHLSGIGASAVAMLIGPRAPMILEDQRVTYIKHTWDFYRPIGWHNNDALIDWDTATAQYEEALSWCQEQFSRKLGVTNLLSIFDFVAFHCNAPYHAKRSLRSMSDRMFEQKLTKQEQDALFERHVQAGTSISAQNVSLRVSF